MRFASIAFSLALLLVACDPGPDDLPRTTVPTLTIESELRSIRGGTIVSYNVENLFDILDDPATNDQDLLPKGRLKWTKERYSHKLEQLAKAISWAGKDLPVIVGLTEVENLSVVTDLAATVPLAEGGYQVVHFDSPDERGIDVALLVRSAYAIVLDKAALPIRLGKDRTRDVLYVKLLLAQSAVLHVFVNHWPSRRGGVEMSAPKRMAAAKVVREKVDMLLKEDSQAAVLIMGDFNDQPSDRSIVDGLRASCTTGSNMDLFNLMCIDQRRDRGSFQYKGQWGYLDQMIVSNGLMDEVGPRVDHAAALWDERLMFNHPKYGLSPDKTYSGGYYKGGFSDHLPIVLYLR